MIWTNPALKSFPSGLNLVKLYCSGFPRPAVANFMEFAIGIISLSGTAKRKNRSCESPLCSVGKTLLRNRQNFFTVHNSALITIDVVAIP